MQEVWVSGQQTGLDQREIYGARSTRCQVVIGLAGMKYNYRVEDECGIKVKATKGDHA